jgi:hypothetical protein
LTLLNKTNHSVPRYKTRAANTPSNSLKLSFTDVIDCSPGTDRAMPVPLDIEGKTEQMRAGLLKSVNVRGIGMP